MIIFIIDSFNTEKGDLHRDSGIWEWIGLHIICKRDYIERGRQREDYIERGGQRKDTTKRGNYVDRGPCEEGIMWTVEIFFHPV